MKASATAVSVTPSEVLASATRGKLGADLAELVKARLTSLVLLTTAVGFYLGARGPIDFVSLIHAFFGTAAAAGGAAALNQWWEWRLDALMQRTKMRPVPAGRMRPASALVVGGALALFGVVYLAIACNAISACWPALPWSFTFLPTRL